MELLLLPSSNPLHNIWVERNFFRNFCLTHQCFMPTYEVVDILSQSEIVSDQFKFQRSKELLDMMIKCMPLDFLENEKLKDSFEQYCNVISQLYPNMGGILEKKVKNAFSEGSPSSFPYSLFEQSTSFELWDIDQVELSRQLCLVEQDSIKKIFVREFLHKSWTLEDSFSPNLDAYIKRTNRMINWMTTCILKGATPLQRSKSILYLTSLLDILYSMNNFQSMHKIIACLYSSAIRKLKNSWKFVNEKVTDIFDKYENIFTNTKLYHELLCSIDPNAPCIPLLHPILRGLFGVEEIFDDYVTGDIVNWDKMRKIGSLLWDFISRSHNSYQYHPVNEIQQMIIKGEAWKSDNLNYEIAKILAENEEPIGIIRLPSHYYSRLTAVNPTFMDHEIGLIVAGSNQLNYSKNQQINEGEIFVYWLTSGRVETMIDGQITRSIERDQIFGLANLLWSSQIHGEKGSKFIVRSNQANILRLELLNVKRTAESEPEIFEKLNFIICRELINRLNVLYYGRKLHKRKRTSLRNTSVDSDTSLEQFSQYIGKNSQQIVLKEFNCSIKKYLSSDGTMYITQNYVLFTTLTLGLLRHNLVIRIEDILDVGIRNGASYRISYMEDGNNKESTFTGFDDIYSVFDLIENLRGKNNNSLNNQEELADEVIRDSWIPSDMEFDIIRRGVERVYLPGEVIIKAGKIKYRRMFNLLEGSINIIRDGVVVDTVSETGEIFGEMQYISNEGVSKAKVVAKSEVRVIIIEGYYLDTLFNYNPGLAGRFYHYIAVLLYRKIEALNKFGPLDKEQIMEVILDVEEK
eukprot:TRINITY_DN2126_c0_g1_i1.p1 TRINITY_DN2126_c0_g1~~TRINITY_DN2126_c0_g1_i1.p1  ORF type:complete len:941 (+),score=173.91 TRINITY_DN2126_c0_g1_i1:417-2825(+)